MLPVIIRLSSGGLFFTQWLRSDGKAASNGIEEDAG